MKTIVLKREADPARAELTSVTLAPERGLMVLQITAHFPGTGEIELLATPDIETVARLFATDTAFGDMSYRIGAAWLFPFAGRLRGVAQGDSLTAAWRGREWSMTANHSEGVALHGLLLKREIEDLRVTDSVAEGMIRLDASAWPSAMEVAVRVELGPDAVAVSLSAKNVGTEDAPVAFGWHPYFRIPSGEREQVRLEVHATSRTEVTNYEEVLPTGRVLPVAGSDRDFTSEQALGAILLDDCYTDLTSQVVRVMDPKAGVGISIEGLTPNIRAVQVYAPEGRSFVAVEHQTNLADPLSPIWGDVETGLEALKPGETAKWGAKVGVFSA